jgi:hypothetical protein
MVYPISDWVSSLVGRRLQRRHCNKIRGKPPSYFSVATGAWFFLRSLLSKSREKIGKACQKKVGMVAWK